MKGSSICSLLLPFFLLPNDVVGFTVNPIQQTQAKPDVPGVHVITNDCQNEYTKSVDIPETVSRRGIIHSSIVAIGISSLLLNTETAFASGGATAGGAYLRSAKQRYNDRVNDGVVAYVSLGNSLLKNSDLGPSKIFLTDENQWKDFASAGYLLSNAFRTSSSTPPDSLPSVQKWKAFAGKVDSFDKAVLKKKSLSAAQKNYEESLQLLDSYLDAVSLPSIVEITGSK